MEIMRDTGRFAISGRRRVHEIDAICTDLVIAADHDASPADIRRMLLRDGVLDAIFSSGKCIEHVLGFVQLRVGTYGGRLVRLHLWGGEEPNADERRDVHSHMWSFKSYVLNGALENSTYRVALSAQKPYSMVPDSALYEVRYLPSGTQRFRIQENVECEQEQAERIGRDASYDMDGHQFHSSQPTEPGTVSLLITQRSYGQMPLVVHAATPKPVEDYPFIYSTASAKRRYLQWARRLIY